MKPRRFHLPLTILLTAVLSFAQNAEQPEIGSAHGSLTDSITARPISRATLTLKPASQVNPDAASITTTSQSDGRFEFLQVPPGTYILTATKAGFLDGVYGAKSAGEAAVPITISAGHDVSDLALTLVPGAVITGTIQNEDGEPFANVAVRALQYKYANHGKRLVPVASTISDDRGQYRFHNLLPGRYLLICFTSKSRAIKEADKTFEGRYPVTYYPSTSVLEKAVTLTLKAGDETIANFLMVAARGYSVRGKISGADPSPPASLEIVSKSTAGEGPVKVDVRDNNMFEIKGMLPGSYRLTAHGVVSGKPGVGIQSVIIEENDLNDVLVDLGKPALPASGYVFMSRRDLPDEIRVIVRLQTAINADSEDDLPSSAGNGSGVPDLYGKFTALAERYSRTMFPTVLASGPGSEDLFIDSVRFNGKVVTNSGFDPTMEGMLTLHLSDGGAVLRGFVLNHDGQPLPGAIVSLHPDTDRQLRPDLYHVIRADQEGHFAITGIAPGTYHILAFEEVDMDAINDPEFLSQYSQQSQTFYFERKMNFSTRLSAISLQGERGTSGR